MSLRFSVVCCALACLLLASCRKTTPPKTWYDVAPLLESVAPDQHAVATRQVGSPLDHLPHYALKLDLAKDFESFKLEQRVYFQNHLDRSVRDVVLRIYVNATTPTPLVSLTSGRCLDGVACSVAQPSPSVVVVSLTEPLAASARVTFDLSLEGKLTRIASGRTSLLAQGLESMQRLKSGKGGGDYGLLAHGDGIASFANFFPVLARFDKSEWERTESSTLGDFSGERLSHVSMELSVPFGASVATSGVKRPLPDRGPDRRVAVSAGLVRDFSFLVSHDFDSVERKVGPVMVRSHFLRADRAAGEKVLDAAAGSLEVFQKRFGAYPYVDLDVVEAPLVGGAGGVEFSGLVTVASMLYRPRLASGPLGMLTQLVGGPGEKELTQMTHDMLEFVTAHEVAHQYFPGLVGSDVRKHPFVDETIAQWSALLYMEDRYGQERARVEADRQVLANYHLMRVLGTADGAVDRPVDAFGSEIAYAGIVYGKGPLFYRELRKRVGDEAFFRALSRVVERYRFRTAPPRALLDEFGGGSRGAEVRALGRRWLDEAHGDADLGEPDLKALLAVWVGPEAAAGLGPEVEPVMKMLLRLMAGQGNGAGSVSLGDLLQLLQSGSR